MRRSRWRLLVPVPRQARFDLVKPGMPPVVLFDRVDPPSAGAPLHLINMAVGGRVSKCSSAAKMPPPPVSAAARRGVFVALLDPGVSRPKRAVGPTRRRLLSMTYAAAAMGPAAWPEAASARASCRRWKSTFCRCA